MSVRKREWVTPGGEERSAWVVNYTDAQGKRRLKTFARKKDADAWQAKTHVDLHRGAHVADSASVTLATAAANWLRTANERGLERSTCQQYRQHVDRHILPFLGTVRVTQLTAAKVRAFETSLREGDRSDPMVRKVLASLSAILSDAQERGHTATNVVRDLHRGRRRGKDAARERRHRGKLQVGVHIPTPAEVRTIIENTAPGRWRALMMTAVFTGLRASELRGLDWANVDFAAGEVAVVERADRYNVLGSPKSAAGTRTVPLTPRLMAELKALKLASGGRGLVFGNSRGRPESLGNIINRCLVPAQLKAGLTRPMLDAAGNAVLDAEGQPRLTGKYTGLHAMRHFFASWCINARSARGLSLPAKTVQSRLGHELIALTMDRYGHLFPRGDDGAELAAGEDAVLG